MFWFWFCLILGAFFALISFVSREEALKRAQKLIEQRLNGNRFDLHDFWCLQERKFYEGMSMGLAAGLLFAAFLSL